MKKRLIDANAVDYENIMCSQSQLHWLNAIIEKQPTVDAVEVLRCKECIYFHKTIGISFGKCSMTSLFPYDDDFCSYGERKQQ